MLCIWNRAFSDGRQAALTGEGPERMLKACDRLLFDGADPAVGVELPLLGAPSYDTLVILPSKKLKPGCRLRDPEQIQAQAVVDWLLRLKCPKPSVFYELDADGSGKLAGVHCRIEGRLDLADGFFAAVDEPQRIPVFRKATSRLPEGWVCMFAAAFPGRAVDWTRMEVLVMKGEPRKAMSDPSHLRRCFDRMGFSAYDREMLEDMAELAGIEPPVTLQFDLFPDGTWAPVCSLVPSFEDNREDPAPLFAEDGRMTRLCRRYQEMGMADGRWRLLEEACFAKIREEEAKTTIRRCMPSNAKAKWKNGERCPAKIYLRMETVTIRDNTGNL